MKLLRNPNFIQYASPDSKALATREESGEFLSLRDFLLAGGCKYNGQSESFRTFRALLCYYDPRLRIELGLEAVNGRLMPNVSKHYRTACFLLRATSVLESYQSLCKTDNRHDMYHCTRGLHISGVGLLGRSIIEATLFDEQEETTSDWLVQRLTGPNYWVHY